MDAFTRSQDEQLDTPCFHQARGSECVRCGYVAEPDPDWDEEDEEETEEEAEGAARLEDEEWDDH